MNPSANKQTIKVLKKAYHEFLNMELQAMQWKLLFETDDQLNDKLCQQFTLYTWYIAWKKVVSDIIREHSMAVDKKKFL